MRGKTVKKWIIIILVFVTVIVFFLSPVFGIKKYSISECNRYSEDELKSELQLYDGKNGFMAVLSNIKGVGNFDKLFSLRLPEVEKKIEFDKPYLKDITVKYVFPSTLQLNAGERQPCFIVNYLDIFLCIDSEGYVVETFTNKEDAPKLPLIKGLQIVNSMIGKPLELSDQKQLDSTILLCNDMSRISILTDIDIIDISDYNNIWMFVLPSLSIMFGGADNAAYKLATLKAIEETWYDGTPNGTLDFTGSGNPIFREN
ncbi:MAG: hypothetical protein LBI03_06110 [Clostridiales bacterium]|nr:hypothetical protein [Clostridiales bacterium]